jgi:hypothetical protein
VGLEHPVHDPRVLHEDRLDGRPSEHEAAQPRGGGDVGRRRLAEEDRDLAEVVAAGERRAIVAVHDDPRLALEDDVEARAGDALADDALALGEPALLEAVGDTLELGGRQVREQGESGDGVDDLVLRGHGRGLLGAVYRRMAHCAPAQGVAADPGCPVR